MSRNRTTREDAMRVFVNWLSPEARGELTAALLGRGGTRFLPFDEVRDQLRWCCSYIVRETEFSPPADDTWTKYGTFLRQGLPGYVLCLHGVPVPVGTDE